MNFSAAVPVRLLLALSPLILLTLTGCGTQVQNAFKVQSDLHEAQREAQIGNTPQARRWADQAIAVDPSAVSTYVPTDVTGPDDLTIDGVFAEAGDELTRRDYLKQAVAKFPNSYRPLIELDQTYNLLGDTADQKATATALAALLEKQIVAPGSIHDDQKTLTLAQAYCDAGNLTKGAADYQAVIRAKPSDPDAYNGLAYAYAVANSVPNLPQARALAQRAVALVAKLTPASGVPQDRIDLAVSGCQDTLGWVQYRQGDYMNARDNIQSAINLAPREAEERYHLGMVYEALHQPDAARAEFTHATLLAQGYAAAQRELSALKQSPTAPAATTETAKR